MINTKVSGYIKPSFWQALALGALVSTPVWADDTEIFFGDLRGGGTAPNVLFIMDTSGSMKNEDGTGISRIDRVKAALNELVSDLNDVNIGLMRFSNAGGPVLYPVSYIDKVTGHSAGDPVVVVTSLATGSDDAVETTSLGDVVVDDTRLQMGTTSTGGQVRTKYWDIEDADDDADENINNGSMTVEGRCYKIGGDKDLRSCSIQLGDNQYSAGLRFMNVDIPKDSLIQSAVVKIRAPRRKAGSGSLAVDISGEKPDTGKFQTSNRDISDRMNSTTTATVPWQIGDPWGHREYTSPELNSIIEEIVAQDHWEPGSGTDHVTLFLQPTNGSGSRNFDAADNAKGQTPRLEVTWSDGIDAIVDESITGLRFSGVAVPRGVTITSARLEFTVDQTNNSNADLVIAMEDSNTPLPYSAQLDDISSRGILGTVSWPSVQPWDTAGATQSSADISALVQTMVNRSAWCGGDAMAFSIRGETGLRIATSFEGSPSSSPKLYISYAPESLTPGSSCISRSLTRNVLNDDDDAVSPPTGKPVAKLGNTLVMDGDRFGLIRFTDVELHPSATISSAYLKVYAGADYSSSSQLTIAAEDTANAGDLSDGEGVSNRSFTPAVTWDTEATWNQDSRYQSADVTAIVRSLQSKTGWNSGNAMLFRLDKSSGVTRSIYAFDNDTQNTAAQLVINYIDDGSEGADSVRQELLRAVESLSASGYTPIQDTVYEAYQYYSGSDVVWGKYRGGHDASGRKINLSGNDGPFPYTRLSAKGAIEPDTYQVVRPQGCTIADLGADACAGDSDDTAPIGEHLSGTPVYSSPIQNSCQFDSHIIMLTDGIANSPHSESLIKGLEAIDSCEGSPITDSERCVKELVRHMHENDMSDIGREQKITTHTIGFNFSSTWLADVAEAGGGKYREASDAQSLVTEVRSILSTALKTDTSFVAPVAAINQFNRLTHLDEIYFAMFRPDDVPKWPGNLKKYKLETVGGVPNVIVDYAGAGAVNPATGFFKSTSQSAWSNAPDGSKVDQGGAGEKLPAYDLRKIYTWLGSLDGHSTTLSNYTNAVTDSNTDLTAGMLAVAENARSTQIAWIRGQDVDDENGNGSSVDQRYTIADPLHSKPVAITYGAADPENPSPDVTVYMGTNAGFLHAINSASGQELFSFIPEELLDEQVVLRSNDQAQRHVYGMDGSLSHWVHDANGDGIKPNTEDFVYLYMGMRRGGRNYYAFDVTDRTAPKIKWVIKGGTGDFAELGQSWARPIPGRIKLANQNPIDVLFISGGYDETKDGITLRSSDSVGRALFVVNANTGQLIWSGGPTSGFTREFSEMQFSIPAALSVADTDSDGLDDVIFVGDTGGQLWRFDIGLDKIASNLISGGVIADLAIGGDTSIIDNRRFYHSPDVALVKRSKKHELAIAIGSGFRPSPLSTGTADRFYMITQDAVFGPPSSYIKLTEADLYDASDNDIGDGTEEEVIAATGGLDAAQGWYISLNNSGEKVLSTPLSFKDTVTFVTYQPTAQTSDCVAKAGTSRFYQVNLANATPVNNFDTIGSMDQDERDRSFQLQTSGIIDEPVIICTGAGCDLFTGAEKPPIDSLSSGRIVRTYWRRDT